MNKPRRIDNEFNIRLNIIEWRLNLYWAFEWGATVKITKWDELIGYCQEEVWRDGYCEFERLKYEYKRDIIKTLIGIKKKDGLYHKFK